ncbi:ribosome biogenesis GTP-binding protein YihA/YsxC [Aureibaculum sp. 2210JD6-5]|uniref:ribosome biogenesis GTP-binding protein YihA/YsxC n=1 Tax=Aureibaculum sp. 2210JD6-5 TaxID=3103957 RepID=UPI002AAC5D27|nr:ribosome biogenesis GTP-binding protein YihA/YsxC [Aureibaculum sp. 2210JD6-5]MDY7394534.1 ribosome biogenesis GTP-binding protein YihA/YsxC [Aureibaculum sp. 2210JD6-5]
MKIKTAEFVVSNTDIHKCPKDLIPEYAFIGRSNVGKSSLINMLTNQKSLAKTSGKPGKTQLINHFKINNEWFLVDLPGYGYAQVSKSKRAIFQNFIQDYFLNRKQLVCTFLLVDSRHEPQKVDLEFMRFLGENEIPFMLVFTKADKLKLNEINRNLQIFENKMLQAGWGGIPRIFVTSATSKDGREELLNYIGELNEIVKEENKSPKMRNF